MPKETFQRLPEEKKKKLIDAFFEEFAANSYSEASVSKVVGKLGIAKGSIYQYFENKKDLYLYLIEYATTLRLENLDDYFNPEKHDFFVQLIENFARKIVFDLEHPVYSAFLFNVLNERNNQELGDINIQIKKQIFALTKEIIQRYTRAGKINTEIDPEIAAFIIVEIQINVFDYLQMKYNFNLSSHPKNNQSVMSLNKDELMEIIKKFAFILKHGLKQNI